MNKSNYKMIKLFRFLIIIFLGAVFFVIYLQCRAVYHERVALKKLKVIEQAMKEYRKRMEIFPAGGILWRNTDSVNYHLGIKMTDKHFTFQCLGFGGWPSFRCNAQSPLYDWKLHVHEGKPVHCARGQPQGIDDSCPTCVNYPKSRDGCR